MPACGVWDLDDSCTDLPEGASEELIAHWQQVATDLLWAASGRRYGLCEVTVRPCLRSCYSAGLPVPYKGSDGAWRNIGCGCGSDCSCTSLCEVILDGPVAEVTQVLIDGTELMAENWRLDRVGDSYRLLRTDGSCWPTCQDFTADCDEEGSFCVTYERGLDPGVLGSAAVTELTDQLVKACLGAKCQLPANVTSVTRRGVTITFTPPALEWMRSLRMVAAFLDSVNPNGLTSASSVWSPDVPRTRERVVPPVS